MENKIVVKAKIDILPREYWSEKYKHYMIRVGSKFYVEKAEWDAKSIHSQDINCEAKNVELVKNDVDKKNVTDRILFVIPYTLLEEE